MKRTRIQKKEQTFELKNIFTHKNVSYLTILGFLSRYPYDSFTLTEVSEKSGISKSATSTTIKQLEKDGYVIVGNIANLLRIKFNTVNLAAIGYKISTSLMAIYASGVVNYLAQKWGHPKAVILFGSVRKGEDGPGSDIDIAIQMDNDKDVEIITLQQMHDDDARKLEEFEQKFERKFKFLFFDKKKIDNNLYLNLINGIALYGLLEP